MRSGQNRARCDGKIQSISLPSTTSDDEVDNSACSGSSLMLTHQLSDGLSGHQPLHPMYQLVR